MSYLYADHIYSTDSLSRFREIATEEEVEAWGFTIMEGRDDVYINPSYPYISFHRFQDTQNIKGRYETVILYRIVDISPGPRKYKEP